MKQSNHSASLGDSITSSTGIRFSVHTGAYSYATPETGAAQAVLSRIDGGAVFFSGEALYRGRVMGTVEAALASGLATARTLLG